MLDTLFMGQISEWYQLFHLTLGKKPNSNSSTNVNISYKSMFYVSKELVSYIEY